MIDRDADEKVTDSCPKCKSERVETYHVYRSKFSYSVYFTLSCKDCRLMERFVKTEQGRILCLSRYIL